MDFEGWYSVTPEMLAKHTAGRICDVYGAQNATVIDGGCGMGGNAIQFAQKCGFCLAVDLDPTKCEYTLHNAKIYEADNNMQVLNKDFLELSEEDFNFPIDKDNTIHTVFCSPGWGGPGYQYLQKYTVDQVHPPFDKLMAKSVKFSNNVILFLPRNTSV